MPHIATLPVGNQAITLNIINPLDLHVDEFSNTAVLAPFEVRQIDS